MSTLPTLANVGWTAPVAEHANFHSFVMDPPRHLDADDFDPWTDELPTYEEVRDGDRR